MSNKMKMTVILAVIVFAIIGLTAFAMFSGYDVVQIAGGGFSTMGHCVSSSSVCTGVG